MKTRVVLMVRLALSLAFCTPAAATTINQNASWTITQSGATQTVRVAAYGDSIFAGYRGSLSSVAKRSAPHVAGEYAGIPLHSNVEIVRRTKSGAVASDIYNNKIVAEASYMKASNVRVVMFEMCGNDGLQSRSNISGQSGTCDLSSGDTVLSNCALYTEKAMQYINANAPSGSVKMVSNLYYPGYDADNALSKCTDPATGKPFNKQSKFLETLVRENWRTCHLAQQYGFACTDSFAEMMGADYDSNGDGLVDSDALRFNPSESEDDYVRRLTVTLRSTIRDSNAKFLSASTSVDYIQSDNTHPTYYGSTMSSGKSGSGAGEFGASQIVGGRNPQWNRFGHERMGWALSLFNPAN